MKRYVMLTSALIGLASCAAQRPAAPAFAEGGSTDYRIVIGDQTTETEAHAAEELALFLGRMTGAQFPIVKEDEAGAGPLILVGPSAKLEELAPDVDPAEFGKEEYVIRTLKPHLILAGGRPRGTLYAVYGLLEDYLGCRWFAPGVHKIPKRYALNLPEIDARVKPVLEYRESFWFTAFNGDWAARNRLNSNRAGLTSKHGGKIVYKGFVHTFYSLVPPAKYAGEHPEYYSEIDGKRQPNRGQLCLTNPDVVDLVVEGVRQWKKETPEANIISVSQNDWHGRCQCAKCLAIEKEEGSPSGPLIRFVNKVAERLEPEFPDLAIDTLAYQYTRMPPKHVRPRDNVIVRLCSIECSFAHPLQSERNKKFADDIRGWGRKCDRLYIWDYTTTFSHYILPFPNLRVFKPNIRFFVANGVKGIFEQGNYHSPGGEFEELKAWLLAKLLWNPEADDEALLDEFLEGYYGPAAPHIRAYIDMLHDKVEEMDYYMGIWQGPGAPYLTSEVIAEAETHFDAAEQAVADKPELLKRVRTARLPVYYVMLCRDRSLEPIPGVWEPSLKGMDLYNHFIKLAKESGVTHLREGGAFDQYVELVKPLPRRDPPRKPPECSSLSDDAWVDMQDYLFSLARAGSWAKFGADEEASDSVAARMPGDHHEWAVQCRLKQRPVLLAPKGKWRVYAVIRACKTGEHGTAFTFGWWDMEAKRGKSNGVSAANLKYGYHSYLVDVIEPNEHIYLWVAPASNAENVPEVFVDRFFAVRVSE